MPNKKLSKVKIFVGYFKPTTIYKSDVYQPILTSNIDWNPNGDVIKDNTDINIAIKNKHYGELSGHYWVWKNFLQKTDAQYIGFCHYRRFLDFNLTPIEEVPFKPILESKFQTIFKKYTEKNILKCIEGYDIILPHKAAFESILYAQYLRWHPEKDMNLALNIIRDKYPEYVETALKVMGSKEMYICLNFIMKKELLNEYFEWIFGILTELEKITDWSEYVEYSNIRTPAFIAERFFNIWLTHVTETRNLKILNTSSFMLLDDKSDKSEQDIYFKHYSVYAEKLKELKD